RDRNVTGVQTCALPIYSHTISPRHSMNLHRNSLSSLTIVKIGSAPHEIFSYENDNSSSKVHREPERPSWLELSLNFSPRTLNVRSEERRVGKECGRQWW